MRFINPAGEMQIVSDDETDQATCDTKKLDITHLNERALSRIHRFVRLWRKLGWTMRELDQAITILQASIAQVNSRLQTTHSYGTYRTYSLCARL